MTTTTTDPSNESQHHAQATGPCAGLEKYVKPLSAQRSTRVAQCGGWVFADKDLLTDRFHRVQQHAYISPSDNIMSPATQKLAAFKTKHLGKG